MNDYKYGRQDDELMHFGVLGMKWGHRSGGNSSSGGKSSRKGIDNNSKTIRAFRKVGSTKAVSASGDVGAKMAKKSSIRKKNKIADKAEMAKINTHDKKMKYKRDVKNANNKKQLPNPEVDGKAYSDMVKRRATKVRRLQHAAIVAGSVYVVRQLEYRALAKKLG